jgi:hypothetical protein
MRNRVPHVGQKATKSRHPRATSRAQADARRWVFDESADGLPFAFVNVCGALDIDSGRLRGRVRERRRGPNHNGAAESGQDGEKSGTGCFWPKDATCG